MSPAASVQDLHHRLPTTPQCRNTRLTRVPFPSTLTTLHVVTVALWSDVHVNCPPLSTREKDNAAGWVNSSRTLYAVSGPAFSMVVLNTMSETTSFRINCSLKSVSDRELHMYVAQKRRQEVDTPGHTEHKHTITTGDSHE